MISGITSWKMPWFFALPAGLDLASSWPVLFTTMLGMVSSDVYTIIFIVAIVAAGVDSSMYV